MRFFRQRSTCRLREGRILSQKPAPETLNCARKLNRCLLLTNTWVILSPTRPQTWPQFCWQKIRRFIQVGQYKIEKLLGAGGMGEVYLSTDKMGRRVALKLLASHLDSDRQQVARFLQEARTVLALNHPNIVTIYDIGETGGSYYIASELIEGENLRRRFETDKLELNTVLEILIQVATALSAAHEKGIVHRDIKPENVMF